MKTLAQDVEAEATLISYCIGSDEFLAACIDKIEPQHFTEPPHPALWQQIQRAYREGHAIDVLSLRANFQSKEVKDYVSSLAELSSLGHCADPEHFIGKLLNVYKLRVLNDIFTEALIDLEVEDISEVDAGEIQSKIEAELHKLDAANKDEGPSLEGRPEALKAIEAVYTSGELAGVSSGFKNIDAIIGGLGNSDLIILAGRPSMGKTSLAIEIAEHTAKSNNIYFASLEMSKRQIETKRLGKETGTNVTKLRQGPLSEDEVRKVTRARQEKHFWIDDQAGLSCEQLLTRARRMQRQHGLDLVVVDYLQLMSASTTAQRQGSVAATTEISKALKQIAKTLDVPVLALSQLSRKVEERLDKRPMLSDLRESGAIEQDADAVMFCYRDEYYLERESTEKRNESEEQYQKRMSELAIRREQAAGKCEVIVAKNRHGRIGTAYLRFTGETTGFEDA